MRHFEFDPDKNTLNKERHGVDLKWAQNLWDTPHIIIPAKHAPGENRFFILARIGGKCYASIFTMRGTATRLISCHRADRRLEKIYETRIQNQEN